MSMRATFTTDFIYDGSEGYQERGKEIQSILTSTEGNRPQAPLRGGNVIGQIAGICSGSDLSESDLKRWIDEMAVDCGKITKVPFKIVWLLEGGDVIIKEIKHFE